MSWFLGQNSIIIVAGANMLLGSADIMKATEVIKSAKVVICQLETKVETTLEALKLAHQNKGSNLFFFINQAYFLFNNIVWFCILLRIYLQYSDFLQHLSHHILSYNNFMSLCIVCIISN